MQIKGKKINFLGDSITEGVGTSTKDKGFCEIIAKENGCICRNYGIGGTRIAHQHDFTPAASDRDFCMRAPEMDNDADIVVVFGGTNDYGHGDAPMGEFSDRTPMTFYGALHTLFICLLEKYPDAEIVFVTPLHRLEEDNPKPSGKILKDYIDVITEVAEYYAIPVLDLYRNSGLQPTVPIIKEKYMPDGLHPNDEGNKIIASRLTGFLRSL